MGDKHFNIIFNLACIFTTALSINAQQLLSPLDQKLRDMGECGTCTYWNENSFSNDPRSTEISCNELYNDSKKGLSFFAISVYLGGTCYSCAYDDWTPRNCGTIYKSNEVRALLGKLQWSTCENVVGQICGTWQYDPTTHSFQAAWANGARATMKIKSISGNQIVLTRHDKTGISAGLKATYTGTVRNNTIVGSVDMTFGWHKRGTWSAQ